MLLLQQHRHLDDQLSHLLEIFKEHEDSLSVGYLERRMNSLDSKQQPTVQDQLKYMLREIEAKESLCKEVIRVSVELFEQTRTFLASSKEKISQLTNENEKVKEQLAVIKEDLQQRTHQDFKTSMACQQLQRKVSHLERSRVSLHERFEKEKEELKKTFIAEVEDKPCQLEFKMLMEENRHLLKESDRHKSKLGFDSGNEQLMMETISKLEQQIERLEVRLESVKNQSEQLMKTIQQKDQMIITLSQHQEKEMEETEYVPKRESEILRSHPEEKPRSDIIFTEPVVLGHELKDTNIEHSSKIFSYADRIRIIDDDVISLHESFPPNNPEVALPVNAMSKKERLYIDPYFSHYVLTSQSVKIKEDKDEYLSVDMKPYYTEIIEKRIPMHLWDQWVRNKLKQVAAADE